MANIPECVDFPYPQELYVGAVQDSDLFAPYVQHQLVTALLDGAYASHDADLALSLATVRSQMAHELYGPGVQHAAALGELVNAQLFKCEKPSAIKQARTLLLFAVYLLGRDCTFVGVTGTLLMFTAVQYTFSTSAAISVVGVHVVAFKLLDWLVVRDCCCVSPSLPCKCPKITSAPNQGQARQFISRFLVTGSENASRR